jgi:hypothetical protein
MAAAQPAETHPDAFGGSIFLDGVAHIFGAGRVKAARRREKRGKDEFIQAEGTYDDSLHR